MSTLYHATQLPLFTPDSSDEIPTKQCTQCSNIYPATLEYFHPNKSYADGLNCACRDCRKKISRESAARRQRGEWAEPRPPRPTPMISLICPTCGKEFQREQSYYNGAKRKRGQTSFYCSRECKVDGILVPLPTSIKEEYLAGRTATDIAKQYGVSMSAVYRRLKSMGVETRSIAYANTLRGSPMKGQTHTKAARQKISKATKERFEKPEQLEAMRQRTIKQMSEGRMNTSSRLEDRVAIELSKQGFAFFRQYPILAKGYQGYIGCVDFILSDGRMIEVNGTYWHCDPRKYPNGPINTTQKEAIKRHSKKMAIIVERGDIVIELWEIDLMADMAGTIARALGEPRRSNEAS